MNMTIRHGDMAYRHFQSGLIDEQSLRSIIGPLNTILNNNFGNKQWSVLKYRGSYSEEFTQYVDEYIAKVEFPLWAISSHS